LSKHPTPSEIEDFVQGRLAPSLFLRIARHLLRGCPSCNALLAPHYQGLATCVSVPSPDAVTVHDEILDRAFSLLRPYRRYLRREEIRRKKIAAMLSAGEEPEALIHRPNPQFKGLGVVQALLDRSWAVRHESPKEMVRLAQIAVHFSRSLDSRWHNERDSADWQARAWGELGNAHRASDDLDEAERAFGLAFELFLQGTGDIHLKAKLYDLHASFLGTRRQFDLAFAALDIAYSTYLEIGDSHLAGKTLITKATYLHYSCQSEAAMLVNEQAMPLIDRSRDSNLLFFSIHNQIWFLVACGRFKDARIALFNYSGALQGIEGRINKLRLRWLRAKISAGLRKWKSAETDLLHVKAGFEEEGMGFAAALASLDLALLWMRQNRYEETERLVLKATEVFVALRIQREALGAMMVLKEAFEKKKGSIGLLEDVIEFLRRWHPNSDERFMPRGE
jgi:tetratricopeptide (TPR) repeat protein